MTQTRQLQVNETPSFFNKEMVIGVMLGPIGMMLGGYLGKKRMEQEQLIGRTVSKTPSFWNKDTFVGALIGNIGGAILGGLLGVAAIVALEAAPIALPIAYALQFGGALGGLTLGAYFGGKHGQEKELAEFNLAEIQDKTRSKTLSHSIAPEPERAPEKSFTQTLDAERAQKSARGL